MKQINDITIWKNILRIKYSFIITLFFFCAIVINMHAQDFQVSMHGAAGFAPDIAADSLGNFIVVIQFTLN